MNKKKFLATLSPFSVGIWRAIGFFILAPLIYNVYSYFANTGATGNLQYLETYINDSKSVQIELPLNREQIERSMLLIIGTNIIILYIILRYLFMMLK